MEWGKVDACHLKSRRRIIRYAEPTQLRLELTAYAWNIRSKGRMKNFVIYTAIVLPLLIFGCCAGSLAPFILEKSLEKSYDGWVLLKSPPANIKRLRAAN